MDTSAMTVGNPVEGDPRLLDRELSWLDFNARVLALAQHDETPILERLKFLAIFSANLDEYFQTRVAALKERADTPGPLADQINAQLVEIHTRTTELVGRQSDLFATVIVPELASAGYDILQWADVSEPDREDLRRVFENDIYPVLTPLAVDPAHPFPYISNVSLNLAVMVRDPASGEDRFARVKVPPLLARFIPLRGGRQYIPIESVIAAHLAYLFPGMTIDSHHVFRVTRDVEIELSDDSEDLLQAIELVLQRQTKFGRSIRLEVERTAPRAIIELLVDEIDVAANDVYEISGLLDLNALFEIYSLPRADLKYPQYRLQTPKAFAVSGPEVFGAIRRRDVLVHHPYDSFVTTVEAFVEAAANDPAVLAIKQTLYRTGGDEEGIAASLAKAALAGKQVVVLVEITARGDEQRNVERARMLEEAGVHVVYGIVGLKTHAKILLVVRREHDGLRRYCHVGTGNYNPKTARMYEDLGLFSADPDLSADVAELFNYLTGYSRPRDYRRIIVAPGSLRSGLLKRIAEQASPTGRIMMKMNALVDTEMVDALYAASQAGASVDLVIRGICCLRPGVPGMSENIRVRSILGRYLEHSRIYCFGSDPASADYFIGSADLMPRNLDRRVEALTAIVGIDERKRILELFTVCLADNVAAWQLDHHGLWHYAASASSDPHLTFEQMAVERATKGK